MPQITRPLLNIVNVGYGSTNYYVLGQGHVRLLVDVGWPGTLPKLSAQLKRKDIPLQDVRYLLVTHYHPDHAGLAQELKDRGARLIVLEPQVAAIPVLKTFMKPINPYVDIQLHDNLVLATHESPALLRRTGLTGEIICTPGHSDDSVSLVLEEGVAFTGDLPRPGFAGEQSVEQVERSWAALRARHVKTIYPGHGPAWPLN